MLLIVISAILLLTKVNGFTIHNTRQYSKTALYYNYDKKLKEGQKKEIGRLWKNIIFPGIYTEYEDTAEAKKEVKVSTISKEETEKMQKARGKTVDLKQGTFQSMDPKAAPKVMSMAEVDAKEKKLKLGAVQKPQGFVAPQPKKGIRGGGGTVALKDASSYTRPKKPLILYEYDGNPECKKVREACSLLDLTVEFRPCPGAISGFSDLLVAVTKGKREVPFMIDSNPSMYKPELLGSKNIVTHLFDTYGPGVEFAPKNLVSGGKPKNTGAKTIKNARNDNQKMKPITVYGWEGARPVTPVRQALDKLGLAHVFINCSPESSNRKLLEKRTKGVYQVPYIIDPNTGVEMFESAEIVKYLENVYTV